MLDNRILFFTDRVVKHWNRLSRDGIGSPSPGIFKSCADVALKDQVQCWTCQCWVGLDDLKDIY